MTTNELVKIVVFVPTTHADAVRQAIGDAGAGKIGNYNHSSFSTSGIARFKPLDGAHPAIGEIGKLEAVEEQRIECICKRNQAKSVFAAIRGIHPYEEVIFDIYPLISEQDL